MSSTIIALFKDRYSTALLADAAFRVNAPVGVMPAGIQPLAYGHKAAGPAVTVECNNDIVAVLEGLHRAQSGDVLVVVNRADNAAVVGDLIGTEAHRKSLAGIVVDGLVRDSGVLRELGLPIFCRGTIPIGPLKLPPEQKGRGMVNQALAAGSHDLHPGDWVFADEDGAIWIKEPDLDAVMEQAEETWRREEALISDMRSGNSLSDLLQLAEFLEKRTANPALSLNQHLKEIGRVL